MNVRTRLSRLFHTDAIGERFINAISEQLQMASLSNNQGPPAEQTIFVRGVNDRLTVSIDSSGNHLHKRGIKTHQGKAPLRETTAAAALLLAGYQGGVPLIDPMCGTGTFSLEAAMMAGGLPAGCFRKFAFMEWPSFRPAHWQHLKNQFETDFSRRLMLSIFASDIDQTACDRLNKCLRQNHLTEIIKVARRNFFDFHPADLTDQTGLVALNPPYGRRLETRRKSSQLFTKICKHLKRKYKGWKVILIVPDRKLVRCIPFKSTAYPISHGGMKPVMVIGKI
jgi:putative N6-adenine-specific DNA methylase